MGCGKGVIYSSEKKQIRVAKEIKLLQAIETLESQLSANSDPNNFHAISADIQSKKLELEEIYFIQAQGAYVRARARYKIEGEKPSRLFCSLEKHNAVQKHIPKLIVVNDNKSTELKEQKSIENNSRFFTQTRDIS